ncbi:hypothetical protein MNBD_NITROSPINAE02-36 [hydrothermal vent metagenome]|uniref:Uncharacterized protein n=1 Tax=hydrothermal vent metagenome TaxID=652676 RepID=A0A3B1BDQ3_9ZZZZ
MISQYDSTRYMIFVIYIDHWPELALNMLKITAIRQEEERIYVLF